MSAANALNAFMTTRQFRQGEEDRAMALEDRQRAIGLENTRGKINALMMQPGQPSQTAGMDVGVAQGQAQGPSNMERARQIAIGSGNADIMGEFRQQVGALGDAERGAAAARADLMGRRIGDLLALDYAQRRQVLASPEFVRDAESMGISREQLMSMDPTDENLQTRLAEVGQLREVLGSSQPPSGVQSLQWRAREAGLQPGTAEYQNFMRNGGRQPRGPLVNVNTGDPRPQIGTIPQGMQVSYDEETNSYRMSPIPGGDSERDRAAEAESRALRSEGARRAANTVLQEVERAFSVLDSNPGATGRIALLAQHDPESDTSRLAGSYDTIRSNLTLDRLQQMRDSSPTGGALGGINETEFRSLGDAIARLNVTDPVDVQRRNLQRVYDIYTDIVKGDVGHRASILGYDIGDLQYTAEQRNMTMHQVLDALEGQQ